jgi:hypothetical protein
VPIDYTKYPPHWKTIRATIMARAQDRCECLGECQDTHRESDRLQVRCDAPHHARILRHPLHPAQWAYAGPGSEKPVRVVLTIAHLCHDSTCEDVTHLRAFCQRCHLRYDATLHARNAARTRRSRLEAQGQITFL